MSSEFTIRFDVDIGSMALEFNVECEATNTSMFSDIDRYSFKFHTDAGRISPSISAAIPPRLVHHD